MMEHRMLEVAASLLAAVVVADRFRIGGLKASLVEARAKLNTLDAQVIGLQRKLNAIAPPWETRAQKRRRLTAELAALQERGEDGRFARSAAR